jgi:hypothetical protein
MEGKAAGMSEKVPLLRTRIRAGKSYIEKHVCRFGDLVCS